MTSTAEPAETSSTESRTQPKQPASGWRRRLQPLSFGANHWRHVLVLLLAGLALLASSMTGRLVWEQAELTQVRQTGQHRLLAVAETLRSAVAREVHLPLVLALDPDVQATLQDPTASRIDALNRKLNRLQAAANLAALYIMDPGGNTLAASNWNAPTSFINQNYGFRPYFQDAVTQGHGRYFGIGITTGRAGYFLSRAVVTDTLVGVAVAKIEFDELEAVWQSANEHLLVTDQHGIVFLTSEAHWQYHKLAPLDEPTRSRLDLSRQYVGANLDILPVTHLHSGSLGNIIRIDAPANDRLYLAQATELTELGWTVHQLTDLTPVLEARRDGILIGGSACALIIAVGLYLRQRRRTRAAEKRLLTQLEERVIARTQALRTANTSLQAEIEERRRTEAELRSTQDDLVQAGKLAALGQMSAAIAHEINQPLTAMRTFVASGRLLLERGQHSEVDTNLSAIGDLAERMARITAHLKTFSRKKDTGQANIIDATRAAERSLELVEPRARETGVQIECQLPDHAWTLGNEIRLEQVLLNLLNNALDAVGKQADARIQLSIHEQQGRLQIEVRDNGPGFSTGSSGQIFDPFFTTKPTGEGLGLGLSISYGIVRDWDGLLRASNHPEGGAVLTVELACCPAPETGANPP